jgi:hypothetical protein
MLELDYGYVKSHIDNSNLYLMNPSGLTRSRSQACVDCFSRLRLARPTFTSERQIEIVLPGLRGDPGR